MIIPMLFAIGCYVGYALKKDLTCSETFSRNKCCAIDLLSVSYTDSQSHSLSLFLKIFSQSVNNISIKNALKNVTSDTSEKKNYR